jgi:ABC-2 type transport system ATP-binding protein
VSLSAELRGSPAGVEDMPGVHNARVEGSRLSCDVDPEHLNAVLQRLTAVGVTGLVCQPPTLEQLFLRHYREGEISAARPAGPSSSGSER